MKLYLQNDRQFDLPLGEKELSALLSGSFPDHENHTVTLKLVSNNESNVLNKEFRSIDKPTNVLSFQYEPMGDHDDANHLGDLAIAFELVCAEAKMQHKEISNHFIHLLIHGVLHLLGFDHEESSEAEIMESREVDLLSKLGISNPYLSTESQQ